MRDVLVSVKSTSWYQTYRRWRRRRKHALELRVWERNGRPAPAPHLAKQRTIEAYAKKYCLKVLVETGTYLGDMVDAMANRFDRIYSIEVGRELFEKARERFRHLSHVEIIRGDSGEVLRNLVPKLDQPALFFLDGHYSGPGTAQGVEETPIYNELGSILNSGERRHVILIDDARMFFAGSGYSSLEELTRFIRNLWREAQISIEDDCIRISPANRSMTDEESRS